MNDEVLDEPYIRKILEVAVRAPSGDNSQPWRFRVHGNTIDIFNMPERDKTLYNFRQCGSLVAHGALIENVLITASHFGHRALLIFPKDIGHQEKIASIKLENKLEKTESRTESLFQAIHERVSNRRTYETTQLTTDQKRHILTAVNEIGSGEIKLIEDTNQKKIIAEAVSINERILFENKVLHKTFFENMVWSPAEERKKKLGLYVKTLELPPPARAAFHLFRFWPVLQLFNQFGLSRLIAKTNAKIYASSAAIGAIIMPDENPENFVLTGRLMQRVWLTATHLGLRMQVLAGILYLAQRVHAKEGGMFYTGHRELIKSAYETLCSACGARKGIITMLFRIGHAQPSSARSSRLPPEITFGIHQ